MEGGTMTDGVAPSPDNGMSGMAGAHSNDDSSGKKRRQQGKQACQQCRRRKIKCDETRPRCRPCAKAKLTCAYELPAGQTRQQALMESQNKIQHELEAHASLIQSLRCLPAGASMRVWSALREGVYDGVLLGTTGTSPGAESSLPNPESGFPWEFLADEGEQDAIGEDDDAYAESATSPTQPFSQYGVAEMHMGRTRQGEEQQRSVPYPIAPQVGSGLPYPGYYAQYPSYPTDVGQQQPGMGIPDGVGMTAGQHQYSPPQPQQFQMEAPSQYPAEMDQDLPVKSKKR